MNKNQKQNNNTEDPVKVLVHRSSLGRMKVVGGEGFVKQLGFELGDWKSEGAMDGVRDDEICGMSHYQNVSM